MISLVIQLRVQIWCQSLLGMLTRRSGFGYCRIRLARLRRGRFPSKMGVCKCDANCILDLYSDKANNRCVVCSVKVSRDPYSGRSLIEEEGYRLQVSWKHRHRSHRVNAEELYDVLRVGSGWERWVHAAQESQPVSAVLFEGQNLRTEQEWTRIGCIIAANSITYYFIVKIDLYSVEWVLFKGIINIKVLKCIRKRYPKVFADANTIFETCHLWRA